MRVRGRVVVEQFERLVRPGRPVSRKASEVHGYHDADLCDQPTFQEVWPEFRAFVGDDLLVAHNGQEFDMPVLRRLAAGLPGLETLVLYDTLPLARSLLDESAKLEDLAHRFGVSAGRSHHALDDASALAGVMRHLGELKLARARRCALVHLLGWLGLAMALDDEAEPTGEERLLRELALPATVGRYGDCLQVYAEEREAAGAPSVEELIERLGGARLIERIRTEKSAAEKYPSSVARLSALVGRQCRRDAGREHRPPARPGSRSRGATAARPTSTGSTCSPCTPPRDWSSPGSTWSARRMARCPDSRRWPRIGSRRFRSRVACSTWE